jgi:spermidine synthase
MLPPPIDPTQTRRVVMLVALSLLAASTLHFEVLLTKFFANKLEHHYTFAIISIALLGFGASGVFVHLRSHLFSPDREAEPLRIWPYAVAYAIALPVSVTAFILLPFDPAFPGWAGHISLPLYFLLFSVPFFLAGVCVSALLVARGMRPTRVYFWDLVGAGIGAVLGPLLLPMLGGYGSVVAASLLAFAAAVMMRALEPDGRSKAVMLGVIGVAVASFIVTWVPESLRSSMHFDMVSFKHAPLKAEFMSFGGTAQTYWNPIARIDVSPTGESQIGGFRYGLSRKTWTEPLLGRMILVDGSANTRQFALSERPTRDGILGTTLWAAPYVLRPESARSLVLGPGGGIDILVGKAYGVAEIDAVELNPDLYELLLGRPEDPEREAYTRWLKTDDRTVVRAFNAEGRHFIRSQVDGRSYDVVLASGVDTLTAIQTAGNALTENYLYTKDAVRDYLRVLSPGGQLALTHWHMEPPNLALRMFVTYLEVLDEQGVEHPGRRVCVISEGFWENAILKKGEDFTLQEVARLRAFAQETGFQVVYDPFMEPDEVAERDGDLVFRALGRANRDERKQLLARYPYDISPVTDDRPYFYWVRNRGDAPGPGGWLYPMASAQWLFALALVLSVGMAALPGLVLVRRGQAVKPALRAMPFFLASGFAFILAENGLFLMLSLFVGGPLYSLTIVLPSLLVGYGMGSLVALQVASATRAGAVRLMVIYVLAFLVLLMLARWALPSLIGLPMETRFMIAVAIVVPFGAVLGLGTPWYMEILKVRSSLQRSLAWMWGVSAAANVVGSLLFVPVCSQLGVRGTFVLAGLLYMAALAWAASRRGQGSVLQALRPAR